MALGSSGPTPSPPELDRLRGMVARYFPVYETRFTPYSVLFLVHAEVATLAAPFDELRRELWPLYYVPQIRLEHAEFVIEVIRRPVQKSWGLYVNAALLVATVVSTVFAGAFLWVSYRGGTALTGTDLLWGGVYFAAPLMLILGLHELAHFVVARRHHLDASLPYFLPVPPPILIFGTFGAFISLREPFPDRKALLDVGAAGPIAGFLVAIPVTLLGLHLSLGSPALSPAFCGLTTLGVDYQNLLLGPSAMWAVLGLFVPGASANLQPLAIAGWVGLLVTAFNLLPAGQLDGGHIARALLGKRSTYASFAVLLILVVLGAFYYFGWFLFAFFILFVGLRHPPPLNDLSPIGWPRIGVGVLAVAILVAGFTLVPIFEPTGSFSVVNGTTSPVRPLPGAAGMADNLTFAVRDGDLVPHAYILSASVVRVVMDRNGSTEPLTSALLAAYAANSTWIVHAPNGNISEFAGTGAFTEARAAYSEITAGQLSGFSIEFVNPQQASVTIQVVVTQLCPEPGVGNTNSWVTTAY